MNYTIYQSNKSNRTNSFFSFKFFIYLFIVLFTVILIIISLHLYKKVSSDKSIIAEKNQTYKTIYENKQYIELIEKMDGELKNNGVQIDYLVYRGFSYFLLAENETDSTKKNPYLEVALFDLRKALAIGTNPSMEQTYV